MQKKILQQVSALLKDGGKCLYVTCTLSKEENEGTVLECLRGDKHLALVDLKETVPDWGRDLIDDHGFLRTFPHKHRMDGFFAARFVKA